MNHQNKLPERKRVRLYKFDYSTPGAYFITVCTQNRQCILSRVVGEGSPLPPRTIKLHLLPGGEILDKYIKELPDKFAGITVDCYVIMPNHLHLLLTVSKIDGRGDPSPTVESAIGWLKYQATKDIHSLYGNSSGKVFQRSFHDHVIRNRDDYNEIYNYICQNPMRWRKDKFYTPE